MLQRIDVDPEIRDKWQAMLDSLAELLDVPSALIMHTDGRSIEVFQASESEGNPYAPGDSEHLEGSGLYCEWVIRNRDKLLVPNALKDEDWARNPDIKLGMISYLGYPVRMPDTSIFGTLCVLDRKENKYSPQVERVLLNYRELIESHLVLIEQRLRLVKTIRGLLPICASCKKIRDGGGEWHVLESYITDHSEAVLTHGLCPDCIRLYI